MIAEGSRDGDGPAILQLRPAEETKQQQIDAMPLSQWQAFKEHDFVSKKKPIGVITEEMSDTDDVAATE